MGLRLPFTTATAAAAAAAVLFNPLILHVALAYSRILMSSYENLLKSARDALQTSK